MRDPGSGEAPQEPSPAESPARSPDTPEFAPPPIAPENELEVLRERGATGPVVLVVPREIFVHFYPAGPEQVINALTRAGFGQVYFETWAMSWWRSPT